MIAATFVRPLLDIMDDLAFTQNVNTDKKTIESVLKVVHLLDPAGVGARNLQECLVLQLHRKTQTPNTALATNIIESGFEQFTKNITKNSYRSLVLLNYNLRTPFQKLNA